jgi:hypothetical protein
VAPQDVADAEVRFPIPYAIDAPGEVALEDYARVLARAEAAQVLREEGGGERVAGVRLASPRSALTPALRTDVEDFARDLAQRSGGGGLGWA